MKGAWFIRPKAVQRPGLRLFCFPFAGGGASAFRPWSKELPPQVELCAVQLPGRESRFSEPLVRSIDVLVRELMEPLAPLLDLPFAFLGHSMGAVVAWEVARELQRRRRPAPRRLFVSACAAPLRWAPASRPVYQRPDPELLEYLKSLNGIPQELLASPELLALVLPIFRADMEALETYPSMEGESLHVPISVFLGEEDDAVPREQAAAWAELTDAGFKLTAFPGDHFYINNQRAAVIRALVAELGLGPQGAVES